MDLSRPFTAISPSLDGGVLVALFGSTTPRSGREIARRTGHSKTGVQRVLDRLVRQGLVDRTEAAPAHLYSLNYEHILAPAVERLAQARLDLVSRLRAAVAQWDPAPTHVSLFGSAARGDGDLDSDIDLLVVRPSAVDPESGQWQGQLDQLAGDVRRWTGNFASVIEISENELPRLRRDRPPTIERARADAIDIAGEPARTLLR
jgi:predicted nucleotidyltransferase